MSINESKVELLYFDALDRSPTERSLFLGSACGTDVELRRRVERLLAAQSKVGDFLKSDSHAFNPTTLATANTDSLGSVIGPYKLLEQIGEGGFGVVYMAEQRQPIRRKVALKVIKPGMDTKQVVARFEAERQSLALMEDPHIARVLDAGTTESGRPYFVMELVKGIPITTFCDERRFGIVERLKLFIDVCRAIHHAHQKGIIHRDIKPSNVLVTFLDGMPLVKVIDFGIAKAMGQSLTENTLFTGYAQLIGTPLYMSPEQASLSAVDVDTRSDVYSLGVLLYELLTGTTPFDKETLSKASHDELRRIICEDEPPRPSARITTLLANGQATVADFQHINGHNFRQQIQGDIDWLVMKALEKDRNRRYATASAFAADVERYLDDKPVEACPPSLPYRMRKFLKRERHTLSAIALVLVAVATGIMLAAAIVVIKDRQGREVARVDVPEGGSVIIGDEGIPTERPLLSAKPSIPGKLPLSGLIPQPQELPGIGRWQLMTKGPRSFTHNNWMLAWSPDSRFLAFGDGTDVRIYAVPTFQLVRVLSGHTNSVIAVDWSLDGRQIASASADNTVRLWEVATGVPGPVLIGHRDRVNTVAWHPNSQQLASGSRDQSVRLWNSQGAPGPVLTGHTQHVQSVAWNFDGTKLASIGFNGDIRIWNTDGKLEKVIYAEQRLKTISWSSDGKQLLAMRFWPGYAQTWPLDGTGGMTINAHSTNGGTAAAWSGDGKQIATASWDNTVRLWSADGTPGPVLMGHDGDVYSVKWSPDGRWIASGGGDRSIRLWSPDGQPGPALKGNRPVTEVTWKSDGSKFAIGVQDHTIRICKADSTQEMVLEGHTRPLKRVNWSPNGQQIVSGSVDGTIRLWDAGTGTAGPTLTGHEYEVNDVSFSPSGRQFASAGARDQIIRIWNSDGTADSILNGHQHQLYEVGWNPVNGQLASVGQDGTLRLWKADGTSEGVFNVGQLLASVTWKPDGTQLASGCEDGTIQLWQQDGRPGRLLKGHADRVTSIAWSDDGRWIASGSRDNTMRLWTADGEAFSVFTGHNGHVSSVRWQPHSAYILSCGEDATVRLWNAATGTVEWILVVLRDKQSAKFRPDGRGLSVDVAVMDREFAYIVEKPSGAMEIVTPSEFERRTTTAKAAAGGSPSQ